MMPNLDYLHREILGFTHGGGIPRPAWASRDFPLWQDFASNVGNVAVTDTHGQTIEAQNVDGTWTAVPANTLTRTDKGLQTVPQRTNSIPNSSCSGSSAPSTLPTGWGARSGSGIGTVTLTVIGTGTEYGLSYVDLRWAGTFAASGQFFTGVYFNFSGIAGAGGIVAAPGQTWTGTVFAKLVSGNFSGLTSVGVAVDAHASGGAYLNTFMSSGSVGAFTPTSAVARGGGTGTTTDASTGVVRSYFNFNGSANLPVDVTVRFYCPQLEQGAFASAPILTSGTALTVNGNQQVVDLTGRLGEGVAGIIQVNVLGLADEQRVLEFNNGTASEQIDFKWSGTAYRILQRTNDINGGGLNAPAPASGLGTRTFAFAMDTDFLRFRAVGEAASETSAIGTWPTLTKIAIGGTGRSDSNNSFQLTKKLALSFGPQDQTSFDRVFAQAEKAGYEDLITLQRALFANGENGFLFYPPWDLSKLFTTSTGPTNVTTDGDPVGLDLDSAKLLNGSLGQELAGQTEMVVNGGFVSATGWTVNNGPLTAISGGVATIKTTDNSYASVYQTLSGLTAGATYRLTYDVVSEIAGSLKLEAGALSGNAISLPSGTGTKTLFLVAQGASGIVQFARNSATTEIAIDNVSVKEVPGNHALQATTTKRPLWKANSGKPYLLFDGTDDFIQTPSTPTAAGTAVVAFQTSGASLIALAGGTTTGDKRLRIGTSSGGLLKATFNTSPDIGLSSVDRRNTDVLVLLTWDATGWAGWVDGALYTSAATVPNFDGAGSGYTLGALEGGSSLFLNGRIYAAGALSRRVTPAEIALITSKFQRTYQ